MEKMQFEKGQTVVYGTNGICTVDEIKKMKITLDSKPEDYYVLKRKCDEQSVIFVPVNNEKLTSKMRDLMTKQEIFDMLKNAKADTMQWNTNRRARADLFRDIMLDGVGHDLLRMVICLFERKDNLQKSGRKLPVTDTNTLKAAVKLIEEEVGYVLEIDDDDIRQFIRQELDVTADIDE